MVHTCVVCVCVWSHIWNWNIFKILPMADYGTHHDCTCQANDPVICDIIISAKTSLQAECYVRLCENLNILVLFLEFYFWLLLLVLRFLSLFLFLYGCCNIIFCCSFCFCVLLLLYFFVCCCCCPIILCTTISDTHKSN